MDSLETTACFRDDLLDFSSDLSSDDDNDSYHKDLTAFSLIPCPTPVFPEYVEEEELEWISNKDAFPMVESFVDIIPNHPSISSTTTLGNQNNNSNSNSSLLSPVSVLENSSTSFNNSGSNGKSHSGVGAGAGAIAAMISLTGVFKVPGKARSKQLRRRRKELNGEGFRFWEKVKPCTKSQATGRKCLHCGSDKTPQWRAGPLGPKTLCNACGVRYKSGRLVPEYRPASSPTFSSELHSNSHRKIVEMRKQKTVMGVGELDEKPFGFS